MPRVGKVSPIRIDASPDAVRAAAIGSLGATDGGDGTLVVAPSPHGHPPIGLTMSVRADGDGSAVLLTAEVGVDDLPFFDWFFRPFTAVACRRAVAHGADTLRAAIDGQPAPAPPAHVVGLPPVPFTSEQAVLLASAGAAVAMTSFTAALFGQLSGPISDTFAASDARISAMLAITRVGALIALFLTALADRRGRRVLIIIGLLGSAASCALSAVSPTLDVFTFAQVLQRAFAITTFTVAGIAVIEEAPEGARAYSASMLALAGGLGFSLAVVVLPFGDVGRHGWRIPFVLGAVAVVLIRPIARHLRETYRYTAVAARTDVARGRLSEIFDPLYRRRFVLLGLAAFLTSMFSAPSSQLMNKYLEDVRDFSSTGIALFRAATTAIPGLVGLLLGGRLAEAYGRRPVAAIGLAIATVTQIVFFLVGGPVLWAMSAASILTASAGGIALGTMDAELFATEVRSTSNALLTVVAVIGSGTGFLMAGLLSDPLGNLGRSIALTGIASLIAAVFVVPRLPESGLRALDDVSPTESDSGP
jgi:MFS family permease